MRPFKIITSDLLIADVIAEIKGNPKLEKLVEKYRLRPGGKISFDNKSKFAEFSEAFDLENREKIPGGSSANTLVTLKKIMEGQVSLDFLGIVGDTDADHVIKKALDDAGVRLLPPAEVMSTLPPRESALSFVAKFPENKDGSVERSIATYPGNARAILKPNMITENMVKDSDAVFVQLSLEQKLADTKPQEGGVASEQDIGFSDRLLDLRWRNNKELWVAMPTQADFSTENRTHDEKAKHFQKLIDSANVVLSNGEELMRVFTEQGEREHVEDNILRTRNIQDKHLKDIDGLIDHGFLSTREARQYNLANRSISIDTALQRLQNEFKKEVLKEKAQSEGWQGNTRQVAFITLGQHGAAIVTKDRITKIPVVAVKDPKGTTLGCGDTAYAGWLAGYLSQHLQEKDLPLSGDELHAAYLNAARIGVTLASAKLQEETGPRLSNPMESLERVGNGLVEIITNSKKNWTADLGSSRSNTAVSL